jgi:hypothetical protein
MLTRLLMKIGKPLGVSALTSWVRAVAEGKHGTRLQTIYWRLVGWKVGFGAVLVLLSGVAYVTDADPRISKTLGAVAALLISLGLTDKAWREWRPPAITDHVVYRILAAHPVELAAAFTSGGLWLVNDCTFGDPWCRIAQWSLWLLAAAAIQLGLLDSGWKAPVPRVRAETVERLKGQR